MTLDTLKEINVKYQRDKGKLLEDPSLYSKLVGNLIHLTITQTISHVVHTISKFIQAPRHLHLSMSNAALDISLAHLVMAYAFLLVLYSNYKPIMMLIRPAAQTLGNLLQDGMHSLVMLLSLINARSKTLSLNHLLRQVPWHVYYKL